MRPPTIAGVGPSKRLFLRRRLGERITLADALGGLLADLNRALRWFIKCIRGRFAGEELVLDAELFVLREAGSAAADPPMTPGCTPG
ncbi:MULTISPECIES: hypothetical protein [Streptomyces]|uniref:hypothetical protein n=1 Tax=Streptomyces TaxID=1883 RepID=UPI0021A7F221|nr:hypothetical protein [Streptomyces atratus]MCT2546840.1 hypothetical protein [Streptomyces atratus]